jgi:hypothetical protein
MIKIFIIFIVLVVDATSVETPLHLISRLVVIDALETTPLLQETIHWSIVMMHTSKIGAPKGERRRSAAII